MRGRAKPIHAAIIGALALSGCVDTQDRAARQNSALVTAGYSQPVIECGNRFRSELAAARQTTPGVPLALNLTVGLALKRSMTRRADQRFRACLARYGVTGEELLPIIDAANEGRAIPRRAPAPSASVPTTRPARASACTPGGNVLSGGTGYCTR